MPLSTVSIAVAHRGEIVVGAVFDPYRDELFTATLDGPAMLNGKSISVSSATTLGEAVIAAGSPPDIRSLTPSLRAVAALSPHILDGATGVDLAFATSDDTKRRQKGV